MINNKIKMRINNDVRAFTLSEVLITLGIIGVIGAMTIPPLINKTNEAELRASWKKNFSNISNATNLLIQENGGSLKNLFTDSNDIKNAYKPYLKYIKECDEGSSLGTCWHNNDIVKYLSGGTMPDSTDTASLILQDGSLLRFVFTSLDCSSASGNLTGRCGVGNIDVNGFKPPNTRGKDIFIFHILYNAIKPYGTAGDYANLYPADEGCSSSAKGGACSTEYLYN